SGGGGHDQRAARARRLLRAAAMPGQPQERPGHPGERRPDEPRLHHGRACPRARGRVQPVEGPPTPRQAVLPGPDQEVQSVRPAEHPGQALFPADPAAPDQRRDWDTVPAEPGVVTADALGLLLIGAALAGCGADSHMAPFVPDTTNAAPADTVPLRVYGDAGGRYVGAATGTALTMLGDSGVQLRTILAREVSMRWTGT